MLVLLFYTSQTGKYVCIWIFGLGKIIWLLRLEAWSWVGISYVSWYVNLLCSGGCKRLQGNNAKLVHHLQGCFIHSTTLKPHWFASSKLDWSELFFPGSKAQVGFKLTSKWTIYSDAEVCRYSIDEGYHAVLSLSQHINAVPKMNLEPLPRLYVQMCVWFNWAGSIQRFLSLIFTSRCESLKSSMTLQVAKQGCLSLKLSFQTSKPQRQAEPAKVGKRRWNQAPNRC